MKKQYTYDECYEIALQCKNKMDMHNKKYKAYKTAKDNNWLDDYKWFTKREKWSKEECYEIARRYKHKKDFIKYDKNAYAAARKHNWLQTYDWFVTPECEEYDYKSKQHCIYAYKDFVNKYVYIGLTVNLKYRHNAHKKYSNYKKEQYDVVKQHFLNIGEDLPEPIILENNLTPTEAQNQENYWINKFSEEGWNILNIAETGIAKSSLGIIGFKWTYDACYEEAKKYKNRQQFHLQAAGAYDHARIHGWLNDYTWFNNKIWNHWDYQQCIDTYNKLEIKNISTFSKLYCGAYLWLKRHNMLIQFLNDIQYKRVRNNNRQ